MRSMPHSPQFYPLDSFAEPASSGGPSWKFPPRLASYGTSSSRNETFFATGKGSGGSGMQRVPSKTRPRRRQSSEPQAAARRSILEEMLAADLHLPSQGRTMGSLQGNLASVVSPWSKTGRPATSRSLSGGRISTSASFKTQTSGKVEKADAPEASGRGKRQGALGKETRLSAKQRRNERTVCRFCKNRKAAVSLHV